MPLWPTRGGSAAAAAAAVVAAVAAAAGAVAAVTSWFYNAPLFSRADGHPRPDFDWRAYNEDYVDALTHTCPYAIVTEEAFRHVSNASLAGNTVQVGTANFGRTGNHFVVISKNLRLGYCCKSKSVWLPPKEEVLAPGVFSEGTDGPRCFDFSSAPDVAGFNSSSCRADIKWGGRNAFHLIGLEDPDHAYFNPDLRECIDNLPQLAGCEAAYYFPADLDVCAPIGGEAEQLDAEDGVGQTTGGGKDTKLKVEGKGNQSAGNLVVHVRSGDIFEEIDKPSYHVQPPLQFYMVVMQHQNWDRVDFVTWAKDEAYLNPVIPELQARLADGNLPGNVHIHTDRTMEEDLRAMMCADGLVLAKSTLRLLVFQHSTAKRFYVPMGCSKDAARNQQSRPGAEVYGIVWPDDDYSIYRDGWLNTALQRDEMVTYSNITGLELCTGNF